MAWVLKNHTSIAGSSGNGGTSSAIDTTGSDTLFFYVNSEITSPAVSDSKGNTWNPLTDYLNGFLHGKIFYAKNATVGTGHTFTLGPNGVTGHGFIQAWAGGDLTAPFDTGKDSGLGAAGSTTIQPGALTPTNDNSLFILGNSHASAGTMSVDSGFTISDQIDLQGGNADGGAMAYFVQVSAASLNPTWTNSGLSNKLVAAMAVFKQSSGVVVNSNFFMLMGVGI